jgi:protoheme ferro-lyase
MAYYRAVAHADVAAAASTPKRIGVLAVNLGTPDAPSYFAVQRYLREFLSDRRVINTSRLIWSPLLYAAILPLRPIRTAHKYRKIWSAWPRNSDRCCRLGLAMRYASSWA